MPITHQNVEPANGTLDADEYNATHDISGASIITSICFAYAGTLVPGNTIAPIIIVPTSLDIVNVYAVVKTPCTSGAISVDVNKNGITVYSTQSNRPIINANSYSVLATIPDITVLNLGDTLTIDIDTVGNTIGTDLTVIVRCRQELYIV